MASHEFLQGLIEATFAGSAGIMLVLLLRRLLRRGFGAQVAYTLWLLVPLAMLATLLPAASREVELMPVAQALSLPANLVMAAVPVSTGVDKGVLLLGLWLAGALTCGLWLCHVQRRFRRGLGPLLSLGDTLRTQGVHPGLPATLGLWRPKIVLPADFEARFDAGQRALVLAHERLHVTRGDPWANAAAALLRCLCWFNPLFHLVVARFRHDQELACDADVLAVHPQQRRRYGDALLNTQLALHTAPLGCHFGFGHPLKERISMLAKPVPTMKRAMTGSVLVGALMLCSGYAAWAAQPAASVTGPANGIAVDIVLRVDDSAPQNLRIVSEADKPFSIETDANGKRYAISGAVSRIVHQGKAALALQLRIDQDGKQAAAPKLVLLNGKAGSIRIGQEIRANDGHTMFRGMRLDLTLTDALAAGDAVTLQRDEVSARDVISILAREQGMTVSGLELIPAGQKLSFGFNGVPLETVLALLAEETRLDVRVVGQRIEISKSAAAAAAQAPSRLQSGGVDNASRMQHPPAYPADALKAGVIGVVVLIVEVDAQGAVTGVAIERSAGDARLDNAAMDAARLWKFQPPTASGKAVSGKVRVPVEFAIHDPDSGKGAAPTTQAGLASTS